MLDLESRVILKDLESMRGTIHNLTQMVSMDLQKRKEALATVAAALKGVDASLQSIEARVTALENQVNQAGKGQ